MKIISVVISRRSRIHDAQVHAELHHACAEGHIDRSVERDIGFRGGVVSNPGGLTTGFMLEDATGAGIRIRIDPAIEAIERVAPEWENLEVGFVDAALGSLIKREFDLAETSSKTKRRRHQPANGSSRLEPEPLDEASSVDALLLAAIFTSRSQRTSEISGITPFLRVDIFRAGL
jgi:hypothetical protein